MKYLTSALFACLLCLPAFADLAIEGETKVKPYKIVRLQAKGYPEKAALIWRWDKKKLDGGRSGDRLWLTGPPGTYTIECMSIRLDDKGNTLVEETDVTVVIEGEVPPTPPVPPVPPVPPEPLSPIDGEGFRTLMLYESADKSKYPAEQAVIFTSKRVQDYLRAKSVKNAANPQGAFRIWDVDTDPTDDDPCWAKAMKRPRKSLPWLLVSNGKTGYEGPLPGTVDETLALLKKYGGD